MRIVFCFLILLTLFMLGCGSYGAGNGMGTSPMVIDLSPSATTAGDAGFTLTVDGSGFGTDSVVFWNGTALPSSYGTGAKVMAQVSAADIATTGMFTVYVRSGGKNSNQMMFTVQ